MRHLCDMLSPVWHRDKRQPERLALAKGKVKGVEKYVSESILFTWMLTTPHKESAGFYSEVHEA